PWRRHLQRGRSVRPSARHGDETRARRSRAQQQRSDPGREREAPSTPALPAARRPGGARHRRHGRRPLEPHAGIRQSGRGPRPRLSDSQGHGPQLDRVFVRRRRHQGPAESGARSRVDGVRAATGRPTAEVVERLHAGCAICNLSIAAHFAQRPHLRDRRAVFRVIESAQRVTATTTAARPWLRACLVSSRGSHMKGTSRAMLSAMLCAGAVTAQLVSGKATRDALFLASLDFTALPTMLVATSVFSILLVAANSRGGRRIRPATLVPATCIASGILFLCEWLLASRMPPTAAVLVYLHISGAGPLIAS